MMEPAEIARYKRHAVALAAKADDAEGLAQMAEIVAEFQAQLGHAARRLNAPVSDGGSGFSWTYLGKGMGLTRQAMRQRFGAKVTA